MVATLAKLPAATSSPDNYLDAQQAASIPGPHPSALWWNPHNLFDLEDGSRIRPLAFRNLFRGHAPASVPRVPQPLRRRTSRNMVTAFDLCFAPDKSVSAVWALSSETLGTRIATAHHQAVLTALRLIVLEFCSWTRVRGAGNAGMPALLLGATFQRIASRAGDPHLRTHCLIFNACQGNDGHFRTIHAAHLYRWYRTAGSIYRNALAWNLTRHAGLAIEPYGADGRQYRIPGVPEELLKLWSSRTRTINKAAADYGPGAYKPAALKQAIATQTGPFNPLSSDPHFNRIQWDLQATPIVGDIPAFRETLIPFREIPDNRPLLSQLRERASSFCPTLSDERPDRRINTLIQAVADWSCGLLVPGAALALSYEHLLPDDRAILDRSRSKPVKPATSVPPLPLRKPPTKRRRTTPANASPTPSRGEPGRW